MKKRIICLLIIAVIAVMPLCACSESGHTLYVKDEYKNDSMKATFLNSDTGEKKEVNMKKLEPGDDYTEFSCAADTSKYDRVILGSGEDNTIELAFNDYVSGWELSSRRFYPYTYGKESSEPKYKRQTFDYQKRTKDVLIWTPEDYDAESEEKYSVIYMTDGQNLFDTSATSTGSWGVAESALAMMSQTDYKFIIVGIANADGWRDDELTPDIGEVLSEEYEDGHGEYFCDFLVKTVKPYIEENYNVYTDREHNSVCGSSSGGIESFYIAMEHPDLFGSVGALSPAFLLYSDRTWIDYLGKRDFSAGHPFVYIYSGSSKTDSLESMIALQAEVMPDNLATIGYPEDKIVYKEYTDGVHNEMYWRAVFPDYLKYAFPTAKSATADEK